MVIFSSDNGAVKNYYTPIKYISYNDQKANWPFRGQKIKDYEEGVKVPFLARWPEKIQAGTESESLIALTDMLATLAHLELMIFISIWTGRNIMQHV